MYILILSGSPRKGGNTDLLVEAFVKGASQKHHVEVVSVHDYKVNPCLGHSSQDLPFVTPLVTNLG